MAMIGQEFEDARERWVIDQLAALPAGLSIIDVGAGASPFRKHCAHLQYTAQDFCQYDGQGDGTALQNGTWTYPHIDIVSDITSIPVSDGRFDAALCTEVIEHVPDAVGALNEISRILKPRGSTLILTAPFSSLAHQTPHYYYTGFSRYFYQHHLERLGFTVSISANGNFFDFVNKELRRVPNMAGGYAGAQISEAAIDLIRQLVGGLQELSRRDKGSAEVLNCGLHVIARRA